MNSLSRRSNSDSVSVSISRPAIYINTAEIEAANNKIKDKLLLVTLIHIECYKNLLKMCRKKFNIKPGSEIKYRQTIYMIITKLEVPHYKIVGKLFNGDISSIAYSEKHRLIVILPSFKKNITSCKMPYIQLTENNLSEADIFNIIESGDISIHNVTETNVGLGNMANIGNNDKKLLYGQFGAVTDTRITHTISSDDTSTIAATHNDIESHSSNISTEKIDNESDITSAFESSEKESSPQRSILQSPQRSLQESSPQGSLPESSLQGSIPESSIKESISTEPIYNNTPVLQVKKKILVTPKKQQPLSSSQSLSQSVVKVPINRPVGPETISINTNTEKTKPTNVLELNNTTVYFGKQGAPYVFTETGAKRYLSQKPKSVEAAEINIIEKMMNNNVNKDRLISKLTHQEDLLSINQLLKIKRGEMDKLLKQRASLLKIKKLRSKYNSYEMNPRELDSIFEEAHDIKDEADSDAEETLPITQRGKISKDTNKSRVRSKYLRSVYDDYNDDLLNSELDGGDIVSDIGTDVDYIEKQYPINDIETAMDILTEDENSTRYGIKTESI